MLLFLLSFAALTHNTKMNSQTIVDCTVEKHEGRQKTSGESTREKKKTFSKINKRISDTHTNSLIINLNPVCVVGRLAGDGSDGALCLE